MIVLVLVVAGVGLSSAVLASAAHALLYKRDPRAQLAWLLALFFIPVFGLVAYWVFGVNRIRRRGRRMRGLPETPPPLPRETAEASPMDREHPELGVLCDRVTRRPLSAGNDVRPLVDGEGAYPAMLAAIQDARRSVCLSTYIFDGDEVGEEFAHALRRAVNRGVEVRVLVDGIGEKYSDVSIFRHLKGVPAARFNRMRLFGRAAAYLNMRTHRKILVADGEHGFTGGMNIGGRHLAQRLDNEERVRDLHFEIRGPVVTGMVDAFADDWFFTTGERLADEAWRGEPKVAGDVAARIITDGPDEDFEKTQWIVLGALASARQRFWAMTPYFIPSRPLVAALGAAALRGVDVAIVLPARNNLRFVHWATKAYLWELLQQGVHVAYQPGPFVHTKYLVADDTFSLVGSSNLDPRSLRLNFELNLELHDERTVGDFLRRHFQGVREVATPVRLDEVLEQPLGPRLLAASAKLFSPYL